MKTEPIIIRPISIDTFSVRASSLVDMPTRHGKHVSGWEDLMDSDGVLLQDANGEQLQTYEL